MWYELLTHESNRKGSHWRVKLDEIVNPSTPMFRRENIILDEDPLLQIASVWALHQIGDDEHFAHYARTYMDFTQDLDWEVLASLSCSPLCPSDILHRIGADVAKQEGLGYILRIVGRNPSTSRETLVNIAEDTSLDDRYRKVAQLNIQKGLHIATTRAS